jgi:ubiquinone/menaquinone biosynthesis C-methylase UbiE
MWRGRLTRALTKYFTEVVGVDVSKSMLEKAMELNADISEKISFIHNTSSDLKVLKSNQFSFILSTIVLQHIPPQNSYCISVSLSDC